MKAFFKSKVGGFDAPKVTANLRMAITRVRMQQNKLVNSVKLQRRQLAELLALQKYESARIKVEQTIREDVSIEGLEALALFLELMANRMNLIAEARGFGDDTANCPPELKESISSVVWASARIGDTVPELKAVRKYMETKFGKNFVQMSISNSEFSVNQRIIDRLGIVTPSSERCLNYLTSVASEYNIENYDEEKLRNPEGLVGSAAAASSSSAAAAAGNPNNNNNNYNNNNNGNYDAANVGNRLNAGGSLKTPSGLLIPPLSTPRDELEYRLIQLKRE